jgi:hypothetical protein
MDRRDRPRGVGRRGAICPARTKVARRVLTETANGDGREVERSRPRSTEEGIVHCRKERAHDQRWSDGGAHVRRRREGDSVENVKHT